MGNAECETAKQDSMAASCAVSTPHATERYTHEKIAFTIHQFRTYHKLD